MLYLTTISNRIHKNGTWAVQKIIQCAQSTEEFTIIAEHLRPFTPPLLLNDCQFNVRPVCHLLIAFVIIVGNYVVQGTLRFGSPVSDFIFDSMVDRCW